MPHTVGLSRDHLLPISCLFISVFAVLLLARCAAPGEPTPPTPIVPSAVTDLAARQAGPASVLTFTLPKLDMDGERLVALPDVEIFRAFVAANATRQPVPSQLVYTVPSALVDTYLVEGRVRFTDPIPQAELERRANERVLYMVRTRVSPRRASADSNVVAVQLLPPPPAVAGLTSGVTESAIELRWSPVSLPPGEGSTLAGYRVYRAEIPPGTQDATRIEPELLGLTPSPGYRDTQFEFGRTYRYIVRSVAQYGAESVESADSLAATLTPRDTFPPAPPRDLVMLYLPAASDAPAQVELSWAISPETDLAGYHVYRSSEEGTRGERLTRELLLTPAFRDTSIGAGRRFFYRVTAVDRSGNESLPGPPAAVEIR